MKTQLAVFAGVFALLVSPFAVAEEADGKITEGRLDAFGADGKVLGPCPLKHTNVEAAISGMVARVTVTQQFHNPFKDKIEAIYVFPLHQDSAVDNMTMTVGDRVVKGQIKERGEAKRIYEEAKAQGKVASLLDQERPNIFTQSVANIEPGEQVTITISYSQTMNWEDGRFEFDFPTVVGPRYIPGGTEGGAQPVDVERSMPSMFRKPDPKRGPEGEPPVVNPNPAEPTDQVPDADRITPPVIEEGFRAGHDISISVTINAGRPIEDLKSVLHDVEIDYPDGDKSHAVVVLAGKAVIPNRDFAISYSTAGDAVTDAMLTHTDERGNFFSMVIQPPARVKPEQVVPRELVFVLDTSGSMNGFPMETSKAMMRHAIKNLRPDDRFNIVTFAGSTSVLFPATVANTEQNRYKALRFIDTLKGAGGTEMMKAINTALGGEHDAKKVRIVCFLTDGYIGNDMAIIGAIKEHAKTTRVFGFGIGGSVNRFLMEGMAKAGRGEATFVLSHEQAQKSADKFYERIDAPVLTDIALDFGGLEVEEVYPKRIEDLFAAKPVVVKGRYTKAGAGVIKLKGINAAGAFEREIPVTFEATNPKNAVLASQWARAKVDDLMMNDMTGMQQGQVTDQLKQEIIGLGLAYNLLTQFTSFVAVEELRVTEGGEARTIRVPVEMPQGVSYSGVFGNGAGGGGGGWAAGATRRSGFAPNSAAPRVLASPSASFGDADAFSLKMSEEATLERLEKMPDDGNLAPAEKRDKLLAMKLDESLRKLAASGDIKPVEVRVTLRDLSDDVIAKLEGLGFKLLAKATSVKFLIGTIPADKLEELALLKVVRSVGPSK